MRSPCAFLVWFLLVGCGGGNSIDSGGNGKRFLDREYATRCEAFEEVSRFALAVHVARGSAEYPHLRAAAAKALGGTLKVQMPTADGTNCRDIAAIGAAADVDEASLYRSALAEFVSLLDPHSAYLTPEEEDKFRRASYDQTFGIGVEFERHPSYAFAPIEYLTVEQVHPKSAWSQRPISPGDRIEAVNGRPLAGLMFRHALGLIVSAEKLVELVVEGDTEPSVHLKRSYEMPQVFGRILSTGDFRAGYLRIRRFTSRTAEVLNLLVRDMEGDVGGLIVDLRGNPGGDIAVGLAALNVFLDRGEVGYVRSHPGKDLGRLGLEIDGALTLSSSGPGTQLPLVLLTDPGSASAAELFVGALEASRALLLGGVTFGKGTGQSLLALSERNGIGGLLALTTFRWFRSDGYCPQARGFRPHVPIADRRLERALYDRRAAGLSAPLFEAEMGAHVVPPSGPSQPPPTEGIQSWAALVRTELSRGGFEEACPADRDCAIAAALMALSLRDGLDRTGSALE